MPASSSHGEASGVLVLARRAPLIWRSAAAVMALLPLVALHRYLWLALSAYALLFCLISAGILAAGCVRADAREASVGNCRSRTRWVVVTFAAVLSLLFSTLIPPMQSPDEHVHLWRAYSLLDGQVLTGHGTRERPENKQVDVALRDFSNIWLNNLAAQPASRVTDKLLSDTRQIRWAGVEVAVFNPAAMYFPVLYAPSAVGLGVARALGQPVWVSVSWARLAMWFVGIVALALAICCTRAGFHTLCAVAVMPMTLAQIGSANLDSMTIPLAMLVAAMMTCGVFGGSKAVPAASHPLVQGGAWSLLLWLILAKPIFLVFLAIPAYSIARGERRVNIAGMAIVLLVLAWWQVQVSHNYVDARVPNLGSPFHRLYEAVVSPIHSSKLIWTTLTSQFGSSAGTMPGYEFYWRSLVGIFGWLDTPLSPLAYYATALLLGIAIAVDSVSVNSNGLSQRSLFATMAFAYSVGTMLLLWVSWTPPSNFRIEGVQGRYFIPLLPMLGMALGVRRQGAVAYYSSRLFFATFAVYATAMTFELPVTLLGRFWL